MTFDFLYDANAEPKSLPNPSAGAAGVGAGVTGAVGAGAVTGGVTDTTDGAGAVATTGVTGVVTGAGVLWNNAKIQFQNLLKKVIVISSWSVTAIALRVEVYASLSANHDCRSPAHGYVLSCTGVV
jgi:hypothetical protein